MSTNFSRTLRALDSDSYRGWFWRTVAALLLLAGWSWWFFLTEVTVYAVSETARLEVEDQVHSIEAPVSGRVVAVHVELDARVEAGATLFELDAGALERGVAEEVARVDGLEAQLGALGNELPITEQAVGELSRSVEVRMEEENARLREAESAAQLAEDEADRLAELHEQNLVSEMDLRRARSDAQQRRSVADALKQSIDRVRLEGLSQASSGRAGLEGLRREQALLEGQISAGRATIASIELEIERRRIVAPLAGRLGEVVSLQIGSFVDEGDALAAIVPDGEVRAVAEFEPAVALGRVEAGQDARLRLSGFPSTQFGSIRATVARVGSESSAGRVRVEFQVVADAQGRAPVRHGLPGTIEVAVEQVSPATLVLRAAGKVFDRAPGSAAAGEAG